MKKFTFKTKVMLAFLLITFLYGGAAFAQQTIKGTVFPNGMHTPLKGAVVYAKENPTNKVFTNNNGEFVLTVKSVPVDIVVSAENYDPQTIKADQNSLIEVYLNVLKKNKNDYGKSVGVRVKLNPESRDGILVFESDDNQFKYWFDNRVYLDGAAYFGDNQDIGNGVDIRRMRFAMKTLLWGHWGGEIDFDFANLEVDIKDAYARYLFKKGQIKIGNYKEPFSMETTTTSRYLTFMERPMINKIAPSRHIGLSVRKYGLKYFFEGGLFFSEPRNPLMQDQNKKQGQNSGYSLTGRFAYAPIRKDKLTLHLGVAGSYRTPKLVELGDPSDSYRYSTKAETAINRKKYIDTDFIENVKYNTLLGLEAAFAYQNFKVQGEYMRSDISRDADKVPEGEDKAQVHGFYGMGSWIIFNGDYYYNIGEAEFSQINFRNNRKGSLEMAIRYDFVDANSFKTGADIPFVAGGSSEGYTIGLTYYFNTNVKVMLNYSYINNDRWADGKGKYDTYKDLPTGQAGIDFSMIQTRVEIDF
ncbi:MAG: porin [Bacteroidetes bacterium]|nr:MAG: porin [Bacteroidota bacterium]